MNAACAVLTNSIEMYSEIGTMFWNLVHMSGLAQRAKLCDVRDKGEEKGDCPVNGGIVARPITAP
jgi:hypothetical protein